MHYIFIALSVTILFGFVFLFPKGDNSILSNNSKKTIQPLSKIDIFYFIFGIIFMIFIYYFNKNGGF